MERPWRLNKLNHPQFTQLINRHDVCSLSETWTNESCDLHLPGYNYKAIHRTIKENIILTKTDMR